MPHGRYAQKVAFEDLQHQYCKKCRCCNMSQANIGWCLEYGILNDDFFAELLSVSRFPSSESPSRFEVKPNER